MCKVVKCAKCDGRKYINHLKVGNYENGYIWWSEPCEECDGKGYKEGDNNG